MACEMELWQEAFRSVEDIQGLVLIGKKSPKPQMMATYYAKLTRIFTVSDSHLFNGCAARQRTVQQGAAAPTPASCQACL